MAPTCPPHHLEGSVCNWHGCINLGVDVSPVSAETHPTHDSKIMGRPFNSLTMESHQQNRERMMRKRQVVLQRMQDAKEAYDLRNQERIQRQLLVDEERNVAQLTAIKPAYGDIYQQPMPEPEYMRGNTFVFPISHAPKPPAESAYPTDPPINGYLKQSAPGELRGAQLGRANIEEPHSISFAAMSSANSVQYTPSRSSKNQTARPVTAMKAVGKDQPSDLKIPAHRPASSEMDHTHYRNDATPSQRIASRVVDEDTPPLPKTKLYNSPTLDWGRSFKARTDSGCGSEIHGQFGQGFAHKCDLDWRCGLFGRDYHPFCESPGGCWDVTGNTKLKKQADSSCGERYSESKKLNSCRDYKEDNTPRKTSIGWYCKTDVNSMSSLTKDYKSDCAWGSVNVKSNKSDDGWGGIPPKPLSSWTSLENIKRTGSVSDSGDNAWNAINKNPEYSSSPRWVKPAHSAYASSIYDKPSSSCADWNCMPPGQSSHEAAISSLRSQVANLQETVCNLQDQQTSGSPWNPNATIGTTGSTEVDFLRGLITSGNTTNREAVHRVEVKLAEMAADQSSRTGAVQPGNHGGYQAFQSVNRPGDTVFDPIATLTAQLFNGFSRVEERLNDLQARIQPKPTGW